MKTTFVVLLLALAGLLTAAVGQMAEALRPPPLTREVSSAVTAAAFTPTTRILANDPRRAPHAIADALVDDIAAVPAGGAIDISTYWLASQRLESALAHAFARGVAVRAIFSGIQAAHQPAGDRLAALLNATQDDDSWVEWSDGAARGGTAGIMHQKTWRFSQVGDARWVVVTGSYNASDRADLHAYALMWQVVERRDVYDAFAQISTQQAAQRPVARPYREYAGDGWDAYFLPLDRDRPGVDPVRRRLERIPAGPRTRVRIAMFSMWGQRAGWLADRLAQMARRGAHIEMFVGPTVDEATQRTLRAAGARLHPGCFADGSYTHSKDMAATWVAHGSRQYRTWIGSDNWTSDSLVSDQAVLGLAGSSYFRQFWHDTSLLFRPGGVPTARCRPTDGVG